MKTINVPLERSHEDLVLNKVAGQPLGTLRLALGGNAEDNKQVVTGRISCLKGSLDGSAQNPVRKVELRHVAIPSVDPALRRPRTVHTAGKCHQGLVNFAQVLKHDLEGLAFNPDCANLFRAIPQPRAVHVDEVPFASTECRFARVGIQVVLCLSQTRRSDLSEH